MTEFTKFLCACIMKKIIRIYILCVLDTNISKTQYTNWTNIQKLVTKC
jgi:hypothetical protein